MKKINTKGVIAVIDGSDFTELRFATKDGKQAFILAEPLADGTRFVTIDEDDEAETDCIHVPGEAAPLLAWCELTDIYGYGEDEESWVDDANDHLAGFDLKLVIVHGYWHRTPVTIEGDTYSDGWFELETI